MLPCSAINAGEYLDEAGTQGSVMFCLLIKQLRERKGYTEFLMPPDAWGNRSTQTRNQSKNSSISHFPQIG